MVTAGEYITIAQNNKSTEVSGLLQFYNAILGENIIF